MKTRFQFLFLLFLLLVSAAAQAQWTSALLFKGRTEMAGTSAGGKVFFAGGSDGNMYVDIVDICDVATNTWTVSHLSEARVGLAAASAGGKAFFAGGYSTNGFSNRVDIYDVATNTWTTASLSQGRYNLCAVSAGGKVFFAGGSRHGGQSAIVDIYDLASNTWSVASLWMARDRIGTTAVGNKVFFAGGYDGSGGTTDAVDVYDLTTNTWSKTTFSQQRFAMGAASTGGKAFFGGGVAFSTSMNTVDIFDSATNAWTTSTLSEARANVSAVGAGNRIFFGGGSDNVSPSAVVDIFNTVNNTRTTTTLSQARSGIAVASAGGKVFFAGGNGGYDYGPSPVVNIYTLGQATVITQQPSPVTLNTCVGETVSSGLVATGGGTLSYQWFKKGSPDVAMPGQTTATLTLNNVQATGAGTYYCVVTGEAEVTSSANVTVSVGTPVYSATPTVNPAAVCAGASVSLTFATSCFPAGSTYTAQLSNASGSFANAVNLGAVVPGNTLVSIPAATPSGNGYLVRIVGSNSLVSSQSLPFTVNAPVFGTPDIVQVPVCAGEQVQATFTASCFPAGTIFTAQLSDTNGNFANPVNLGTVTPGTNPLTIPGNATNGAGYRIRIVASGGATTAGSTPFTVTTPAFATVPSLSSTSVCAGTAVDLDFNIGSCGFPAGNAFTAQLSDAFGSFGNPVSLGTVTPGSHSVTIPAGTATGTGYKIRILASNPNLQSAATAAFAVTASAFVGKPTVSGGPVCAGQSVQLSFAIGCFPAGTTFTAELSDANGSFVVSTKLGTVTPGSNQVAIPAGTISGTGYRIRINSSNGTNSSPSDGFQIRELKITIPGVNGVPVCAGQLVSVSFGVEFECPLRKDNSFTAQLSDASGKFLAPVSLGKVNPGSNPLQIPFGTLAGTGYKIRILASNPKLISPESAEFEIKIPGFDGAPTLSLVPVCAGNSLLITFGLTCPFPAGSTLSAELSDKNGSFAAPSPLGLVVPGTTNVTVPATSPSGSGYRIRVKSSTGDISLPSANFQINAPAFAAAPTVNGVPVCVGKTFVVVFSTVGCSFPAVNAFTAQLSNANGDFGAATSLGVVVPGSNTVTLPANLPTGNGYKVRIVASKPSLTSLASSAFAVNQPEFGAVVTVSGTPVCKGSKVVLNFTTVATCAFGAGNQFKAQLSDASGSFASPVALGVVTPDGVNITIPSNTPSGTGYRIRVVSNNPSLVSASSAPFGVNTCKSSRQGAADETGLTVLVSPNPSTEGRLHIQVSGVKGQLLHVELLNGAGVSIRRQIIEQAADEDEMYWDISQKPVGLYLLRVNAGFEMKTVKVLH
jgi:hypothetical protein